MRRLEFISKKTLLLALAIGMCSAQTLPVSPDAAATVIKLTGQVELLRDSQPWALQLGSEVKPGQLVTTGPDGYALFQVSDGSTFEVFPNSRVVFRSNPGNWRDLLDLVVGRIKVHIEKLNGQPNHNRVHTPTAIISVRGTIFDITVEDSDTTLVLVEEGQVAVEHRFLPSAPKLLNPGEWLKVYRNEPLAQKSLDRGSVISGAFRAIVDALYTSVYRTGGSPAGGTTVGGGTTTGGGLPGGLPGDKGGGSGSAPAPPPAPPKH